MSLPKSACLSPFSTSLHASPPPTLWTDHYAVLGLSHNGTTEEIKAQFRTLRGKYFASDAAKYRAAQGAYAVLVDAEARKEYDAVYRVVVGLPPVDVEGVEGEVGSSTGTEISTSRSRTASTTSDSAMASSASSLPPTPPRSPIRPPASYLDSQSSVKDAISKLDALQLSQSHDLDANTKRQASPPAVPKPELDQLEPQDQDVAGPADPNRALKQYAPGGYTPFIGSVPYQSYVPLAVKYLDGAGGAKMPCTKRPGYQFGRARLAMS